MVVVMYSVAIIISKRLPESFVNSLQLVVSNCVKRNGTGPFPDLLI